MKRPAFTLDRLIVIRYRRLGWRQPHRRLFLDEDYAERFLARVTGSGRSDLRPLVRLDVEYYRLDLVAAEDLLQRREAS